MKLKNISILVFLLSFSMLSSCVSDEDKEYSVRQVVYSNTKGVPITLNDYRLVIKDFWEKTDIYPSRSYSEIVALSDDKTVLITAEIYVNGKLKAREEGNGYVKASYQMP